MALWSDAIAASTDDAHEAQDASGVNLTGRTRMDANTGTPSQRDTAGFRFTDPPFSSGDTIDDAVISWPDIGANDDPNVTLSVDDQTDSPTFSSGDTPFDRTPTTTTVQFVVTNLANDAPSVDFAAVVQELSDSPGTGDALTVLCAGNSDFNSNFRPNAQDAAAPAALSLNYTAAGGDLRPGNMSGGLQLLTGGLQ